MYDLALLTTIETLACALYLGTYDHYNIFKLEKKKQKAMKSDMVVWKIVMKYHFGDLK
jgi:hypothetical protein